jgi:hypothetical protein
VGVLDVGVPMTPKEWRAWLANAAVPNPQVFKQYEQAGEQVIRDLVTPIVQGARDSQNAMNDELAELIQVASGQEARLAELRQKIKRREIPAKEARKERDRIRREEMKLSQLLESITDAWARETYVADHPEDVLNVLYDRYPALPRPQFPI